MEAFSLFISFKEFKLAFIQSDWASFIALIDTATRTIKESLKTNEQTKFMFAFGVVGFT